MRKLHRLFLTFSILVSIIGCDHASKTVMRDTAACGPLTYLSGLVHIRATENTGAFMSIGDSLPPILRFWIFEVSVSMFLIVVAFGIVRARSLAARDLIGLSLVLAGGLGNLLDRLNHGSVTDFLLIELGNFHTGIFNFADVAVVTGMLLLFLPKPAERRTARLR